MTQTIARFAAAAVLVLLVVALLGVCGAVEGLR